MNLNHKWKKKSEKKNQKLFFILCNMHRHIENAKKNMHAPHSFYFFLKLAC